MGRIGLCVFCLLIAVLFVTVRAGTAYRKIWRLVNNFLARIIRFTVQKFQLFWVIFCIIIFFIELWHILILCLAKMPNVGMPVFTLIATGWRYRKIFFYKKALHISILERSKFLRHKLTRSWAIAEGPRCVVGLCVEILPIATQQCRNYLNDKSWTNRSYEVGMLHWAAML